MGQLFSEWKGIPSDLLRASGHTSGVCGTPAASDYSRARGCARFPFEIHATFRKLHRRCSSLFGAGFPSLRPSTRVALCQCVAVMAAIHLWRPSPTTFFTCDGGLYESMIWYENILHTNVQSLHDKPDEDHFRMASDIRRRSVRSVSSSFFSPQPICLPTTRIPEGRTGRGGPPRPVKN